MRQIMKTINQPKLNNYSNYCLILEIAAGLFE